MAQGRHCKRPPSLKPHLKSHLQCRQWTSTTKKKEKSKRERSLILRQRQWPPHPSPSSQIGAMRIPTGRPKGKLNVDSKVTEAIRLVATTTTEATTGGAGSPTISGRRQLNSHQSCPSTVCPLFVLTQNGQLIPSLHYSSLS